MVECDDSQGFLPWKFHMTNDKTPTQDDVLNFCLKFDQGKVTGTVFDSDGNPLSRDSSVTGTRTPTDNPQVDLVTMHFAWDNDSDTVDVITAGAIFKRSTGRDRNFVGLFHARAIFEATIRAKLLAPGDGDTGTATGNQT